MITCKKHGLVKAYGKHCSKCNIERNAKLRRNLKSKLVRYKGGKCELCGYDKCTAALEFHHLTPNKKDFSISASGQTKNFEKAKAEVDKCMMICANCHREVHSMV
jgi:hypothetical protein